MSLLIFGESVHSQSLPEKVFCRFRNKEYAPGDVWYPTSSISYGSSCIICTCLSTGRQNCTKQECPSDCHLDRPSHLKHPCCKVCDERDSDSSQSAGGGGGAQSFSGGGVVTASDPESGEEEDEDGDLVTENSEFVSCLHQGKIYRDGESFTANVSGLPIQATDQCMQCMCQTGMVLCQMKACSSFKCSSSGSGSSSSGFSLTSSFGPGGAAGASSQSSIEACCQRCAAWRKPRGSESNTNIIHQHQTSNSGDLDYPKARSPPSLGFGGDSSLSVTKDRFGDQTQRPVDEGGSGSSGSIESSITFRDGGAFPPGSGSSITMSNNLDGSSVGGGGGNKEKTSQFDDCVSAGRYYMHGSSWHPVIGPFGTMECVVCKCMKGQIDCGRLKCPPKKELPCAKPVKVEGHCCPICTSMISNDGSKMCVSGKQEVTALRSHGIGLNNTELVNFAFIKQRRNTSPQVDLHEWTLRDGEITQFSTKYISLPDFNEIKTRQTFTLLGATNEKNLDKFTRREKKLEKKGCVARCAARISSLERSLRIHRLIARKQCLMHERSVNT
ncbi:Chordin-like protein 1 [Folsomia candida]|uniref:Chordin-like protein 1 n=1 Tax=Folsomia candida TaxID=158441 RepID=A0A226E3X2_FOLCA|nr:Chordin-like protein 1 [Folsomia candida]